MLAEIHFDYVIIGDDVEVGALLLDDGEVIDSALHTYEGIREKGNNYQFSILAWRLGVEMMISYCMREGFDFDGIEFCNQNETMFKWFEKRSAPDKYLKNLRFLSDKLAVLRDFNVGSMHIKLIKGTDNRAKKILKKRKDKKVGTLSKAIDLGNLDISAATEKPELVVPKRNNEVKPYGGDVNLKDRVVPASMSSNVVSMDDWDRKKA